MEPVKITFKFTKTTANFQRFDEPGEKKTTGALYVLRSLMPEAPAEITATLTAAQ